MSKTSASLEVVAPAAVALSAENLTALAGQVKATYQAARTHAQLAILFAVRVGLLCEQAKAALPRGKYEEWLKEHGIAKVTAHRDRLLAKSSMMELLPTAELTAPDFLDRIESDRDYRQGFSDKVKEVAGEATVTDVMKDLGIIRKPANVDAETGKRLHYPAAKAKKESPEQIAKANRAAAKTRIVACLSALKAAVDDKHVRRFLLAKDWIDIERLAQDRLKAISTLAGKAAAAAAKEASK